MAWLQAHCIPFPVSQCHLPPTDPENFHFGHVGNFSGVTKIYGLTGFLVLLPNTFNLFIKCSLKMLCALISVCIAGLGGSLHQENV